MSSGRGAALLAAGYAFVASGLALGLGLNEASEVRGALRTLAPISLELTFLLIVAGLVLSREAIRESLPRRRFRELLLVGLLAWLAVVTLPPRTHRIFYDEDIYENVAQNIVWLGRAQMCNEGVVAAGAFRCDAWEYNKEPNAFPFLLSLGFRWAGVDEGAAHAVNHLVFAVGAMAVYWLAGMLFSGRTAALGAAAVYVLTPQNLLWGATVAAEPSASAFAALALGAWLFFLRRLSASAGLLAASTLAFAAQFRPESGLVLAVAGLAVLLLAPALLRRSEIYRAALLVLVLVAPGLAHGWSVRHEEWGAAAGPKFSAAYLEKNAADNLLYLVGGRDFPRLYALLALVGLAFARPRRASLFALLWFAAFFGVFLPFYAGSYRYGADVRFSLVSSAPLALLAGAGLAAAGSFLAARLRPRLVAAAPLLLVLWAFTGYLPFVRAVGEEASLPRADHEAARRFLEDVPEDAIVLSHNPGMIQVLGRSAAQTSHATYQPARVDAFFQQYAGGVYFHYSFWCNVADEGQNQFCNNVLKNFGARVVREESAGFYRYVLYRLLPRVTPP